MIEGNVKYQGKYDTGRAQNHISFGHHFEGISDIEKIVEFFERVTDLTIDVKTINKSCKLLGKHLGKNKIELYNDGQNAGVLIHEIAHIFHDGHGEDWKNKFDELLEMYEENWENINHFYYQHASDLLEEAYEEGRITELNLEKEIDAFIEAWADEKTIRKEWLSKIVFDLAVAWK